MLKKSVLCGTATVFLAGLFYLSLRSKGHYPSANSIAHRVAHIGAFGVLALLLLPLARNRRETWLITAAIFCVACGMELLQLHVFRFPGGWRSFEWWDVRDNIVGILLALLTVRVVRLRA